MAFKASLHMLIKQTSLAEVRLAGCSLSDHYFFSFFVFAESLSHLQFKTQRYFIVQTAILKCVSLCLEGKIMIYLELAIVK
jgi:hypothetical protein